MPKGSAAVSSTSKVAAGKSPNMADNLRSVMRSLRQKAHGFFRDPKAGQSKAKDSQKGALNGLGRFSFRFKSATLRRSPFEGMPEEVNLHIAICLANDAYSHKESEKTNYADLLHFCLLNKTCSHAGQEALVRHCDLTLQPRCQVFFLLRTIMFEKPDLADKICSLKIHSVTTSALEHPVSPGSPVAVTQEQIRFAAWPLAEKLRLSEALSSLVLEFYYGLFKKRLYHDLGVNVFEPWAGHLILLMMAHRLSWLTLCGAPGGAIGFVAGGPPYLQVLHAPANELRLGNLPLVPVETDPAVAEFGDAIVPGSSTKLSTLQLDHEPTPDVLQLFEAPQAVKAFYPVGHVRKLILGGCYDPLWLAKFLECIPCLETFTYNIRVPVNLGPRRRQVYQLLYINRIWTALLWHKGTLKSITINVCRGPPLYDCASQLSKFSSLERLELRGELHLGDIEASVSTYGPISEPPRAMAYFTSPCLKHLVIAPSSHLDEYFAIGRKMDLASAYEEFLPAAKGACPALQTLVLAGILALHRGKIVTEHTFNEELLKMMQGGLVYLVFRDRQENRIDREAKNEEGHGKKVFDFRGTGMMKWRLRSQSEP